MFSLNPPAALDRSDDGREVVVAEHHVRRLACDVGAGEPHRDPDVGVLQRRRIVHAVTGHRHDLAARLPRADDSELVERRDARVHADAVHHPAKLAFLHRLELRARQHQVAVAEDPDLSGAAATAVSR